MPFVILIIIRVMSLTLIHIYSHIYIEACKHAHFNRENDLVVDLVNAKSRVEAQ